MSHKTRMTAEKLAGRLKLVSSLIYRRRQALPPFHFQALDSPQAPPLAGPAVDDSGWELVEPGAYWGAPGANFTLRTTLRVPDELRSAARLALFLPIGNARDFSHPEALAYLDGEPFGTVDRHHDEIALPPGALDGHEHLLALNGWTGRATRERLEQGAMLFMGRCAVVEIDQPTRDFVATARVALGVVTTIDETHPARDRLLNALDAAFIALDTREPFGDAFYAGVGPAHELLREGIARAGSPLDVTVAATGHAHIDVAWLWTLGQTRRKAQRTFYTVLRLMEQFPDYQFTQSQPQLYDFVRRDDPRLFDAIKGLVGEGRWEVTGNTWVEPDCNLTGPESLARQFLLGQAFVRQHFGARADSPVLWLPDVFGFTWSLPQLMKLAGVDYFMTIKLGWSRYNRIPYDSFWWHGIDGSRVLTHFSTAPDMSGTDVSTYNAEATPQQIIGAWTTFQQKELEQEMLMAFGYGDGGGGPTAEMLENLREMQSFPAAPRAEQKSVADFFRGLEQSAGPHLPEWHGELYLEYHRGTYTTQSRVKRANRKSEFLLHDAEFLASWAALLDPGYSYPADDFHRAWELVCLNQFHDILPGSSITPVYAESLEQYEEVRRLATAARDGALASIAEHAGGDLLVANPTSFARDEPVFWPGELPEGKSPARADGEPRLTQPVEGGALIDAGDLPPYSLTALSWRHGASAPTTSDLTVSPRLLENSELRVELDDAGDITRIYDKRAEREVLQAGQVGNQFQAFEDRPLAFEAWDIDIFYTDKMWTAAPATSIEVVESGPLRAMLEIRRRILNSDYVQRVSLTTGSPHLDFATTIDWRERHILLKTAFPVEVFAPNATYEIQWGSIERPTHRNTSWDWARFEVPAQKWVDLSESGFGVSLLNDCKYGHDIRGGTMRISLLRSPTSPDPEADQGEHHFDYSLVVHPGNWRSYTIGAAYALNDPPIAWQGSGRADDAPRQSLVTASAPNIVIETVKQAEDGRGIIVRLYEAHRRRGPVPLRAGFPLASAHRCNLVEQDQEQLAVEDNAVALSLRPFEIVTLRLVPGR